VMLIFMVCMILAEQSLTPMFYTAFFALISDAVFTSSIGYYSVPYTLAGLLIYLLTYKRKVNIFVTPALCVALAWVVKDVLMGVITLFMGYDFSFWQTLLDRTLMEMLINAVLAFVLYFVFHWLYQFSFIRPQRLKEENYHVR